MQHITGISRMQMRISSLEDTIEANNPVRFIDAFNKLNIDLNYFQLQIAAKKTPHSPPNYTLYREAKKSFFSEN